MNDLEERKILGEWLVEDFGEDSDVLMRICCDKATGRPLYFSHIPLALESLGSTLPLPSWVQTGLAS